MGWELRGSVGKGGDNSPDDVAKVITLLNVIPEEQGGPSPKLLPYFGETPELLRAIGIFQKKYTSSRDSRIDRGGATWKELLRVATVAAGGWLPPAPNVPVPQWRDGQVLRRIPDPTWDAWGDEVCPLLLSP